MWVAGPIPLKNVFVGANIALPNRNRNNICTIFLCWDGVERNLVEVWGKGAKSYTKLDG